MIVAAASLLIGLCSHAADVVMLNCKPRDQMKLLSFVVSREGGDIGLFITLVRFLIRWLQNFREFYLILIGWFINLSVQKFHLL